MFRILDFLKLFKNTDRMTESYWEKIEFMKITENWGDPSKIAKLLVLSLDGIRRLSGKPLSLTCTAFTHTGHSPKSQHYLGNAADWRLSGLSLLDMWIYAERFNLTGIGLYPNPNGHPFIHTDVRPLESSKAHARWIAIPNTRKDKNNTGQWTYIPLNNKNFLKYVV